jgi:hypothetical protein
MHCQGIEAKLAFVREAFALHRIVPRGGISLNTTTR